MAKDNLMDRGRNFVRGILFDPEKMWIAAMLLWFAEIVVNVLVINKVKYTEIDWEAYMDEVEGVVNGTYDYMELKGGTGPLVYPAGFVYVYMGLYYLTSQGANIRLAQYVFAALYLANLFLVFKIYSKTNKIPPYVLFFICCTSYRIHSIYILRLFNDPVAMFFLYVAVNCFMDRWWNWGCFWFSIGVSIKMNVLLFAPALLLLLLTEFGFWLTIPRLFICGITQVILAVPFLRENPVGYLLRAFELSRQFQYKWTVNWRLLTEEWFLNRYFQSCLLGLHLILIILFVVHRWNRKTGRLWELLKKPSRFKPKLLDNNYIVSTLFTCNFLGITFSRTLHYQFYVWYFHTLPWLLWSTNLPPVIRLLLLGVIEMCWNTYPSTTLSSTALHVCHLTLLISLWLKKLPPAPVAHSRKIR